MLGRTSKLALLVAITIGSSVMVTPSASADEDDCPPGKVYIGFGCADPPIDDDDDDDDDHSTGCAQQDPTVNPAPCEMEGYTFSPELDRYLRPLEAEQNERHRPPDGDLVHLGYWTGPPNEGRMYEWRKLAGWGGGITWGSYGYMWLPSGPGEPEPVDPEELARVVLDGMDLEPISIGMAPKPVDQVADSMGLVGAPVWMWAQNPGPNTWGPITDSGSEGSVTVTVTAQVDHAEWDLGAGPTVTCDQPGNAIDTAFGVSESPACGQTYQQRSRDQPDQAYTVSATTHWTAEWEASTGETGTLDVDPLTSTAQVRIGERQLIEQ